MSASSNAPQDAFSLYSHYYDLLYRDKDYPAEADYVAAALRGADASVRSILEFGSGTGRHGRLLAERGFDVTGIERSASMVAAACQTGVGASSGGSFRCQHGDIRSATVDGAFDAVISLFHVVCYQTTNEDLRATFANAARHLRAGGLFLFDVWNGAAVLTDRPSVRVKTAEDDTTRLWRLSEPELNTTAAVVRVRYTILATDKASGSFVTVEEEHRMRYLFPTEIELLADGAGFDVVRGEEFVTRAPVSDRTFGVAYLLRKR